MRLSEEHRTIFPLNLSFSGEKQSRQPLPVLSQTQASWVEEGRERRGKREEGGGKREEEDCASSNCESVL